jgi:hypothetical protein
VIAIFKQKSPGNIVVLLLFGLLLKLPLFLYPKNVAASQIDGRLYQWLMSLLPPGQPMLYSVIAFSLLYIQAIMLNYMVNEYRMIVKATYLPAMSFLLITSLLPEWNYLSSPMLANTFIIWMFIYLFRLYNSVNAKAQVYNIGLIAGVTSYIYFPSAAFVICILIGLMILKPFRLNEIVLFFLGCLTSYYFHAVYLFLFYNHSGAEEFNMACRKHCITDNPFSCRRLLRTGQPSKNADTGKKKLECAPDLSSACFLYSFY